MTFLLPTNNTYTKIWSVQYVGAWYITSVSYNVDICHHHIWTYETKTANTNQAPPFYNADWM